MVFSPAHSTGSLLFQQPSDLIMALTLNLHLEDGEPHGKHSWGFFSWWLPWIFFMIFSMEKWWFNGF
jgi:hypothetical protein